MCFGQALEFFLLSSLGKGLTFWSILCPSGEDKDYFLGAFFPPLVFSKELWRSLLVQKNGIKSKITFISGLNIIPSISFRLRVLTAIFLTMVDWYLHTLGITIRKAFNTVIKCLQDCRKGWRNETEGLPLHLWSLRGQAASVFRVRKLGETVMLGVQTWHKPLSVGACVSGCWNFLLPPFQISCICVSLTEPQLHAEPLQQGDLGNVNFSFLSLCVGGCRNIKGIASGFWVQIKLYQAPLPPQNTSFLLVSASWPPWRSWHEGSVFV